MKSVATSLALGLTAATATMSFAQDRGPGMPDAAPDHGRFTQEDRAALTDGRIAGLKAALRLTPDQEKLWPPVEQALRERAKERAEAAAARRERWASFRESRAAGKEVAPDPAAEMRARSDRMAQAAASLRKLADATGPLYASLDEAQKRRFGMLLHMMGRHHMMGGHHGMGGRHGWRQGMGEGRGEEMGRGRRPDRHGALEEHDRDFASREGEDGFGRFQR